MGRYAVGVLGGRDCNAVKYRVRPRLNRPWRTGCFRLEGHRTYGPVLQDQRPRIGYRDDEVDQEGAVSVRAKWIFYAIDNEEISEVQRQSSR